MKKSSKTFIENTKSLINAKGYKQKYVAEKMNITDKMLSAILNYRKVIDVEIVCSLCKALDVSPNELFGYETP